MAIYQYKSTTDFDKNLELQITEVTSDRNTTYTYRGFMDINHAQRFATWWQDRWYWGYFGQAVAITEEGTLEAVVLCTRHNSCD